MNYSIFPLVLILASLGAIVIIIVRKYPQLTLLDVDSIPEVKEEKKKEEFLRRRVEEKEMKAKKVRSERWKPFLAWAKQVQLKFRVYVGQIERRLVRERQKAKKIEIAEAAPERTSQLRTLLNEGVFAFNQNDVETAEKKYIAAIRLDEKNVEAYRGLADVYYKQGQVNEAKQTYKFLLHLEPNNDAVLVKLAEIAEGENDTRAAIDYYQRAILLNENLPTRFVKLAELLLKIGENQTALEAIQQAVDLEQQNPKYLDMLVEISIMVGNKELANEALNALRMVNPDNQKLTVLRDKISQIEGAA